MVHGFHLDEITHFAFPVVYAQPYYIHKMCMGMLAHSEDRKVIIYISSRCKLFLEQLELGVNLSIKKESY